MDLFMFSDTVGKGLPMWLPKGAALRIRLQEFLRSYSGTLRLSGSDVSALLEIKLLYITSGHYAKYGKDSFQPIHTPEEGEEYFLKPMNCPHHCMIYKNSPVLIKICLCAWPSSVRFAVTNRVASFMG